MQLDAYRLGISEIFDQNGGCSYEGDSTTEGDNWDNFGDEQKTVKIDLEEDRTQETDIIPSYSDSNSSTDSLSDNKINMDDSDSNQEDQAQEDQAQEDQAQEDQAQEDQAQKDQAQEDQAQEDQDKLIDEILNDLYEDESFENVPDMLDLIELTEDEKKTFEDNYIREKQLNNSNKNNSSSQATTIDDLVKSIQSQLDSSDISGTINAISTNPHIQKLLNTNKLKRSYDNGSSKLIISSLSDLSDSDSDLDEINNLYTLKDFN